MYLVYFDGQLAQGYVIKCDVKEQAKNKVINLIDGGDVTILKDPYLRDLSITFSLENTKQDESLPALLRQYMRQKRPIKVVVLKYLGKDFLGDISLVASVESVAIVIESSNEQTVTVNLREYRSY